jgi:hypothetical protein
MANLLIAERPSPHTPPGQKTTPWRATLALGAKILQDTAPLEGFDAYVVGFHPAREEPHMQEAHHYCRQVNEDFLQCVLFDGNTPDANLIGVEYIVSERLFATLPEAEQGLWHPHNYEILGGDLIAPGLPEAAEHAFLRLLVNSYGKTWHTWHTGRHDQGPGDSLPLGEPMLMWSFNRDGEADLELERSRNERFEVDKQAKQRQRADLAALARPQSGVDLLRDAFPDARPVHGVEQA